MIEFKTIARPYLIQRGQFKDIKEETIAGLDSLISYDYMGSSEFEWGALPQSLKRMTSSWNTYGIFTVPKVHDADGLVPFLLCRKSQAEDILVALKVFMEEEYPKDLRTKERVCLYDYLNPKSKYDLRTDFWWDVTECDNDWMLCFGAHNMRRLVMAINKVCIKHESTLIGPEAPEPSFKPRIDFEYEQDHSKFVVTIQDKKTILVRKNLVSIEEWPEQLKIMVRTKTEVKPIYLKACHGQYRQTLVNSIKEIITFNNR
jgi:hypothetical protein